MAVWWFSFTIKGLAFRVGGVVLATVAIEMARRVGCGVVPLQLAILRSMSMSGGVLLMEVVPVGMGRVGCGCRCERERVSCGCIIMDGTV